MKELPILFTAPMVRALLDGSKSQTRRIVKSQPPEGEVIRAGLYHPTLTDRHGEEYPGDEVFGAYTQDGEWALPCPYGQPGDRLWVRESWRVANKHDKTKPIDLPYDRGLTTFYEAGGSRGRQEVGGPYVNDDNYPADGMPDFVGKGRPNIFMPRVASRILLENVSVRVERLQDISQDDARAEGITDGGCVNCGESEAKCACSFPMPDYRDAYYHLWEQINGAGSWAANPWVWCVEFKRVTP